jgi:hypothetical protein
MPMNQRKSLILWGASCLFSVGGWIVALPNWAAATTPAAFGGLLMILASVTATALGGSIVKPYQK